MSETKLCPYCSEEIKTQAIKCKHCKSELFSTPQKISPQKTNSNAQHEQPAKNKPSLPVKWGWVAAVALIIIIFSIAIADKGDSPALVNEADPVIESSVSELSVQEESAAEEKDDPVMFFLAEGDVTSFNQWDYKLTEVQFHNSLGDSRPRGIYAVFLIEVKNNANVTREIGTMFQIEDDGARIYDFDSSASLDHYFLYKDDAWYLEDIGPTFTAIMPIVFDISPEANTLFFYPIDMRDSDYNSTGVFVADTNF